MDDTDVNATNYLPLTNTYVLEVAQEVDTVGKLLELRDREGESSAPARRPPLLQTACSLGPPAVLQASSSGLTSCQAPCAAEMLPAVPQMVQI